MSCKKQVIDLLSEGGRTRAQIAREVGCSSAYVTKVAEMLGLTVRRIAPEVRQAARVRKVIADRRREQVAHA